MRGIEGQVAVRAALPVVRGTGSPIATTGQAIDTRGFRSAVFYFMFDVDGRETEEISVTLLTVQESAASDMGSPTTIWTCGTDKTIRGETSTLPSYLDPNFPSSEGQQPRILVIEDLNQRQRYLRALAISDKLTDITGVCFLLDPIESLTTDAEIAGTNGEAVYIGGAL